MDLLKRFFQDERGSHLFEYALGLIVGIAVAAVLYAFRDQIKLVFGVATSKLNW